MKTVQELVDKHFIQMCEQGDLEQVQYWLINAETQADIHAYNDGAIIGACAMGHLNVVQYLLTSPELTANGIDFSNIHADDDMAFRFAYATMTLPTSQTKKVVDYLINDYGIAFTERIKNEIKNHPNEEVSKMFLKRSLKVVDGNRSAIRDSFYSKLRIVK